MKESETTVEKSLEWALGQSLSSVSAVHARVLARELVAMRGNPLPGEKAPLFGLPVASLASWFSLHGKTVGIRADVCDGEEIGTEMVTVTAHDRKDDVTYIIAQWARKANPNTHNAEAYVARQARAYLNEAIGWDDLRRAVEHMEAIQAGG